VPPGEHFGDSLREAIDHTIPTTSVKGGIYTPDAQGGLYCGNGKFVSLANSEFEKGN
jgi:hypothetical protein